MNINKIYLIANDDKKFASWMNEKRKKLSGTQLDIFNSVVGEVRYGTFFIKATFVSNWEMETNNKLLAISTPLGLAAIQQLIGGALESGRFDLVEMLNQMSVNYIRTYQELSNGNTLLEICGLTLKKIMVGCKV